jgi:hypothetical protein
MAAKKSSTKKTTSTKAVGGKVEFHKPGVAPESVAIKAGFTLQEFVDKYNLTSYDVFVNGDKASMSTVLKKGDTVRVGLKTKNA